jgi:ribosomal protein S18 acetylase RimI-like enzyme
MSDGGSGRAHVRPAAPSDADEIAAVHVASWRTAYAGLIPQDVLDDLSVERRAVWWRHAIGREEVAVAVAVDGRDSVVGFVATGASRDEDAPAGTGEVYAIYLLPELWGLGVGALLHAAAVDDLAMRFGRATLWVLHSNDRAIEFYRGLGWTPDGGHRQEDIGGWRAVELRFERPLDPTSG